jgi:hypothetical protein
MQEDLGLRAFVSMVDLNNFRSCLVECAYSHVLIQFKLIVHWSV